MPRERLKRRTGCLRCKRRHKRCDEFKPKCSYCSRWQLECIWPDTTTPEPRVPAISHSQYPGNTDELDVEANQSRRISLKTPNKDNPGHDPLHKFLAQNLGEPSGFRISSLPPQGPTALTMQQDYIPKLFVAGLNLLSSTKLDAPPRSSPGPNHRYKGGKIQEVSPLD
jgi:hypothetical protein